MSEIIDFKTREARSAGEPSPHKIGHIVVVNHGGIRKLCIVMGRTVVDDIPHFLVAVPESINEDGGPVELAEGLQAGAMSGAMVPAIEIEKNISLELAL